MIYPSRLEGVSGEFPDAMIPSKEKRRSSPPSPGFPRSHPVRSGLLPGGLLLALLTALPAQEPPVTLSASFSTDRPEAILFPGDSVAVSLEAAVHPDLPKNWETLVVRLAANLPETAEDLPMRITVRTARSATTPLVLNKWYYAKEIGLTAANPSLKIMIEHRGFTREPLVLTGEVHSPQSPAPASTAQFPVSCAGFDLSDIGDPANPEDDRAVLPGSAVFLTHLDDASRSLPVMPRLVARVYGLPDAYKVHWRFTSRYPRRGDLDSVTFPKSGWLILPATESWRVFGSYFGHFFGGDASLSFEVAAPDDTRVYKGTRNFRILCKNPGDQASREYIKSRSGEFWFAWAISQHESRQWKEVYNQFNERGNVREEPNFGPPDGWGIFQIDSARGQKVSTKEVWDWRENVFAGFEELKTAKQHSHDYIAAIKRTYPQAYDGLPPSYTPPGCRTTLTWEEASIMQLYNGAAIVRKMKNAHGTYSYYRSCWKFLPGNPPGKRWVFVRNRNNYVYKVVKHEIEDQMGTAE